jgi:hypothetical protein
MRQTGWARLQREVRVRRNTGVALGLLVCTAVLLAVAQEGHGQDHATAHRVRHFAQIVVERGSEGVELSRTELFCRWTPLAPREPRSVTPAGRAARSRSGPQQV